MPLYYEIINLQLLTYLIVYMHSVSIEMIFLNQHYNVWLLEQLDDGHNFTLAEADLPPDRTEDFHIYENIIINDESIKLDKCQKERKDLNNCHKSSLRTLWCETLEVIQSGILGMICLFNWFIHIFLLGF